MTRARLQHGVERGVVQRDEPLRMLQGPAPAADLCSRQWVWRARGRTHLVADERDARTPQHAQAALERVRKVSKLVELLHRQRRLRPPGPASRRGCRGVTGQACPPVRIAPLGRKRIWMALLPSLALYISSSMTFSTSAAVVNRPAGGLPAH